MGEDDVRSMIADRLTNYKCQVCLVADEKVTYQQDLGGFYHPRCAEDAHGGVR